MHGFLFKLIRQAHGHTQPQMANACGVSRETIGNWENDVYRIPKDAVVIAEDMGRRIVILFEELEKRPTPLSEVMAGVSTRELKRRAKMRHVVDILRSDRAFAPQTVLKMTAEDRNTLKAYTKMRNQPNTGHANIIAFWQREGFTPSPEAQAAILQSFPDILSNPKG